MTTSTTLSTPAAVRPRLRRPARSAITELFEAHCGLVWRTLRRLGVQDACLEDAVQEVFITAFRRWDTFEGRSTARTWLYGISRRIASRYRRAAITRHRYFDHARGVDRAPIDAMARTQAAQTLERLVADLDEGPRTVFVLSEIEGLTGPEVAEALGIPIGTAYSRLRAAWQQLGRLADAEEIRVRGSLGELRVDPPAPRRRDMRRALLAVALGRPAAAATAATWTSTWVAVARNVVLGTALGVGATTGIAATVELPPPAAPHPFARTRVGTLVASATTPTVVRSRHVAAERWSDHLAADAGSADAEPEPAAPARERIPRAVGPSEATAEQRSSELLEEVALLRRAQHAARDGDIDLARTVLREHRSRYPTGQLAQERAAVAREVEERITP